MGLRQTCTVKGCSKQRDQGISVCVSHARAWNSEDWDVRHGTVGQRKDAWVRFLAEVGPR